MKLPNKKNSKKSTSLTTKKAEIVEARRMCKKYGANYSVSNKRKYQFLKSVYVIYDKLGEEKAREYLEKKSSQSLRKNTNVISGIIKFFAECDNKKASKYSSAVYLAIQEKIPSGRFIKFLKENGGIQKCAGKYAEINAKKNGRKRSLRPIIRFEENAKGCDEIIRMARKLGKGVEFVAYGTAKPDGSLVVRKARQRVKKKSANELQPKNKKQRHAW